VRPQQLWRGDHYATLEKRRQKGAKDPHRLVELIARAEEMIGKLNAGGFELTGEYAVTLSELDAMVPLIEEAATIPGFEDGRIATTANYLHTAVMLSARAFLLGIASAQAATFVPRAGSPTPDMNVIGDGGGQVEIEVYTPQRLCHPIIPTLTETDAEEIVAAAFRRKKEQLATGDSILLIGGFGCDGVSIDRLKAATENRLAPGNRRPNLAAIAFYVIASWARFGGDPEAPEAEGVNAGAHTGLVLNSGYKGTLQLRPLEDLPSESSSARLVPNLAQPGTYFLATDYAVV